MQNYGDASKLQRLGDLAIDGFLIAIALVVVGVGLGIVAAVTGDGALLRNRLLLDGVYIAVVLAYYILFEGLFGRTVGKMITGTRVVSDMEPSFGFKRAFLRSLVRLVPFEPFSFLMSDGWHDQWTGTRVVRVRPSAYQTEPFEG